MTVLERKNRLWMEDKQARSGLAFHSRCQQILLGLNEVWKSRAKSSPSDPRRSPPLQVQCGHSRKMGLGKQPHPGTPQSPFQVVCHCGLSHLNIGRQGRLRAQETEPRRLVLGPPQTRLSKEQVVSPRGASTSELRLEGPQVVAVIDFPVGRS